MPQPTDLQDAAGQTLPGYLNASAGAGRPALIIIHEVLGLNGQIRSVADRLAEAGYVAFAIDLFRGQIAQTVEEGTKISAQLDRIQAADDIAKAVKALGAREPKPRLGVLGFCMGGGWAIAAAAHFAQIKACVPFYGLPAPQQADLGRMKARVLGHYAKNDTWCTPEKVKALEVELKENGVQYQFHEYDAGHAFFNDQRPEVYAPDAAKQAWERTVSFLKETLG